MKKRILKISAFFLALALIAGVCGFANGLVGNPISKMMAQRTAQAYLETIYADTDYSIETISYNFKDGNYYVHLTSPSSMDGDFTLSISMLGELTYDDYASRVIHHGNTANRLYSEYREMVDSVLKSHAFPYTVSIGYGDLAFDREYGEEAIDGALLQSDLINDKFYNVGELGATNGTLVLYIDSDMLSNEKAAEILLKTKELMNGAGISFYSIHLVLQYPLYEAEEEYIRPKGEIDIRSFLCSDIYEEDLVSRVIDAIQDTKNYYKEQNKLK